nr:enolase C-terminal domain-like protein [Caballeronia sp. dw_19]
MKAICTAPEDHNLVVVRVETTVPGLYGVGCASFPQRPLAVAAAVHEYLRPFAMGRDVANIEDVWQACYLSSYYRNSAVLNCALSGLDQALWDIKGKRAGIPVYQLFGGKTRQAADVYTHVKSDDCAEIVDQLYRKMSEGFRYVRCQPMSPSRLEMEPPAWDPQDYFIKVPQIFAHVRAQIGTELQLLHDIHERLPPIKSIRLAKALEEFDLFYLEDPFAPEDDDWLRTLRSQCATPIASGEMYVNQREYVPLIRDRLIDFIRVHVSMIGGLTPARKLAVLAEFFGVRTAWHGPGDMSPVGHAAQLHLELSCSNFGIREAHLFSERALEVFPGTPEIRDGRQWCNEQPGLGIDIDEKLAARYPLIDHPFGGGWPEVRRRDGSILKP